MSSFCNLPKEVVEEIMSWLPADSLIRFKSVNKSWYAHICALISDKNFVAKHLDNTKSKPSTSVILHLKCPHPGHCSISCMESSHLELLTMFHDDVENGDLIHPSTEDFKLPHWRDSNGFDLQYVLEIYHCDGIIVLLKNSMTMMVCNPVLQEFKLLPESKLCVYENIIFGVGFGYDSDAKAYKIVRILYDAFTSTTRTEVYTLGTDNWREIDFSLSTKIVINYETGALYSRGFCYWVVEDVSGKEMVLCFDMCSEEFYVIQFPDPPERIAIPYWAQLYEWNDSVALIVWSRIFEYYGEFVEMFVMDDSPDGVKHACSWVKHQDLPLALDITVLLKNDELLMKQIHGKLAFYNIRTKKLRNLDTHPVHLVQGSPYIWPFCYVKSLVSVLGR